MFDRLTSTTASLWRLITMQDSADPYLQKINDLNNATHRLKELDGAAAILPEADAAISALQHWKENRDKINSALSDQELREKHKVLNNASTKFTLAKYLMISCSILNILTMFHLLSENENYAYSQDPFFDSLCKTPLKIAFFGGALEGSIHFYKAKRYFTQLQQLAQAELQSLNPILNEINRKDTINSLLDGLLTEKASKTEEMYYATNGRSLYSLLACCSEPNSRDLSGLAVYEQLKNALPRLAGENGRFIATSISQIERAKFVDIVAQSNLPLRTIIHRRLPNSDTNNVNMRPK